MAPRPEYKDIDEYIAAAPKEVQPILRQVRRTIRKAAPEARETISYRVPAYMLNGPLVYFAAFPDHISLYPAPRGAAEFKKELAPTRAGRGRCSSRWTSQFPTA